MIVHSPCNLQCTIDFDCMAAGLDLIQEKINERYPFLIPDG